MADQKEWTLMFYFASDNPLAPSVISQLKAIKSAGYHPQANVIVQFDPFTEDTPTHVFDVNIINKLKHPAVANIGFESDDPFVRNLVEDRLWRDETDRHGVPMRDQIRKTLPSYSPGIPPNGIVQTNGIRHEPSPRQSLDEFLRFCASNYPAKHYILFIIGHGVVVANDIFLFDEHADEQTLSLTELRSVLDNFKLQIQSHQGTFEMVGFHSCSVSSLEVAFELQKTAKYMLASEGTTFVGSWPYRQILIRIFNDLSTPGQMQPEDVESMLEKIFFYCLHNSTDFLLGGYPFDLCLCDLREVGPVKEEVNKLSRALIDGLNVMKDPTYRDLILLSHLKSQSFFQETYTDVIDFCRCMFERTRTASNSNPPQPPTNIPATSSEYVPAGSAVGGTPNGAPLTATGMKAVPLAAHQIEAPDVVTAQEDPLRNRIADACRDVILAMRKCIVQSGFAGPEYQYARGLSIYFPWSRPSEDSGVLQRYAEYKLAKAENGQQSWLDFLNAYFVQTMRDPITEEQPISELREPQPARVNDPKQELIEDEIALVYTQAAPQTGQGTLGEALKIDKTDPQGGDCTCPSIKNFPRDTRKRRERKQAGYLPLDERLFRQF